jgi:SAM-dependent methyltransferase
VTHATRYAELPLDTALQFHALEASSPFAHETGCARYRFAASLLSGGERVLDVGCGPGYGCPILKRGGAATVVGLDEQAEMAGYAARRYGEPGVEFITGSGFDRSFAPHSFDVITAFEVIEHVAQPERLLERCATWLEPGGRLVISTPNRIVHQLMGIVWEFHEREYGYSELLGLLEQVFDRSQLEFYGQNPLLIEHFRLGRGRFTPVRSPVPRAVRALVPRAVVGAIRRVVPRKPRPVSPSDPDLADACRIEAHDLDVCETFVVIVSTPA